MSSIPANALNVSFPHRGISEWDNPHGIHIFRLHYSADEAKTPEWAAQQKAAMTNPANYEQEYEISFTATLGSLIYVLDDEASLEPSFPIPPDWTRRMALDPHPSVPHAFLWCATDPWGDRWYYRELWPSRVCFREDNGRIIGKAGPCPEDEPVIRIKDYVEAVKWLESADNPENLWKTQPFAEQIYARVIDYAARAFGKGTSDDAEQPNFQQRFEQHMVMPETRVSCPYFEDAKKDHDVGFEICNAGLKPFMVEGSNGKLKKTSRIHIFSDKCPELIYQLKNVRRQVLTPLQVQRQDPTGKAVEVRNHLCDCFRYLEMSNPRYIDPNDRGVSDWRPRTAGIAY